MSPPVSIGWKIQVESWDPNDSVLRLLSMVSTTLNHSFAIALPWKLRLLRELWTDLQPRAALPAVTSYLPSQKPAVVQPVPATHTHCRTPSHRNQAPEMPGSVLTWGRNAGFQPALEPPRWQHYAQIRALPAFANPIPSSSEAARVRIHCTSCVRPFASLGQPWPIHGNQCPRPSPDLSKRGASLQAKVRANPVGADTGGLASGPTGGVGAVREPPLRNRRPALPTMSRMTGKPRNRVRSWGWTLGQKVRKSRTPAKPQNRQNKASMSLKTKHQKPILFGGFKRNEKGVPPQRPRIVFQVLLGVGAKAPPFRGPFEITLLKPT